MTPTQIESGKVRFMIGKSHGAIWEIEETCDAFLQYDTRFDWPEYCYGGRWMVDCSHGSFKFDRWNVDLPETPKSWDKIYGRKV